MIVNRVVWVEKDYFDSLFGQSDFLVKSAKKTDPPILFPLPFRVATRIFDPALRRRGLKQMAFTRIERSGSKIQPTGGFFGMQSVVW